MMLIFLLKHECKSKNAFNEVNKGWHEYVSTLFFKKKTLPQLEANVTQNNYNWIIAFALEELKFKGPFSQSFFT